MQEINTNIQDSQNTPYFAPRTIGSVLRGKAYDHLEQASLSGIASFSGGILGTLLLTTALMYTDYAVAVLGYAISWNSYIIPKLIGSAVVVFRGRDMLDLVRIATRAKPKPKGKTIEGIPVDELLDHLFTFESFKRDEIEEKFGIPRNRFDTLAKKLDDLEVLTRAPRNNARILNKAFSRQDIAAILEGKTSAKELEHVLKKVDAHSWTAEPTAKMIQGRVDEATVRESRIVPPIFTMRPIR